MAPTPPAPAPDEVLLLATRILAVAAEGQQFCSPTRYWYRNRRGHYSLLPAKTGLAAGLRLLRAGA